MIFFITSRLQSYSYDGVARRMPKRPQLDPQSHLSKTITHIRNGWYGWSTLSTSQMWRAEPEITGTKTQHKKTSSLFLTRLSRVKEFETSMLTTRIPNHQFSKLGHEESTWALIHTIKLISSMEKRPRRMRGASVASKECVDTKIPTPPYLSPPSTCGVNFFTKISTDRCHDPDRSSSDYFFDF